MSILEEIFTNVWFQRAVWSVVVILVGMLIYNIIAKFLNRKEAKSSKIMSDKKNKTFVRMLKSIAGYVIGILVLLTVLQIFGVNVTSMLAGVGIASIVIGFALQDAMKDIFRGFDIISDGYYEIGDVIKYGDNMGQVQSISLRTTKLQDMNTMNIVSIANRNIDQVEVVSGYIYIPIPMPYELKVEEAENILKEIIKRVRALDRIKSADYQGITALAEHSLNYQIVVTCEPMSRLQARRDVLGVIMKTFEENKISVPYNQIDVHNKK